MRFSNELLLAFSGLAVDTANAAVGIDGLPFCLGVWSMLLACVFNFSQRSLEKHVGWVLIRCAGRVCTISLHWWSLKVSCTSLPEFLDCLYFCGAGPL